MQYIMQNEQNAHYTPPQLAEMFNVNVSTIKRWIDKSYIEAKKTPGGHRRVEKTALREFIKSYPQYAPNSYILRQLQKEKVAILSNDAVDYKERYYSHLEKHHQKRAYNVLLNCVKDDIPVHRLLDDVIIPAVDRAQIALDSGSLSIYDHRKMVLLVRQHLMSLSDLLTAQVNADAPTAIVSCIRREYSELPLHYAVLLLRSMGWNVHLLGINIPNSQIRKTIADLQPDLVSLHHSHVSHFVYNCFYGIARTAKNNDATVICTGDGWNQFLRKSADTSDNVHFVSTMEQYESIVNQA